MNIQGDLLNQLQADPLVTMGVLSNNNTFRSFLREIPSLLDDILDEPLNISTLMEAQYRCVDRLVEMNLHTADRLRQIRSSLSQYEDAKTFLETLGVTEEAYCAQVPGMTSEEFNRMKRGEMTVGDLLNEHPAVILAPFFRTRVH